MANETVENNDEMCLFKEVEGDLFSCPYRSSMAVSVSEEFKMGRGIAVMFKKRFGQVDNLWNQNKTVGQVAILKDHERYIYYLITKQWFYYKPTYPNLGWSLVDMRNHCVQHGVKELAMPRIECGLGLLEWTKVSAMIKEIFTGTGISITIYNWVDKEEKQEVVNKAPDFRHLELKEKGQQMSGMGSASSRTYIPGLLEHAQPKKKQKKKNKNRGNTHAEDVNGDDGDDDNEQQSDRPLQKSNFNSLERTQGVVDPSENRGKWDRRPSVAEEDSFIVFGDEPKNEAPRRPHSEAKSKDDDEQLLSDFPESWYSTEILGASDEQKNELAQEVDQPVDIKDGNQTSNEIKPNLEPKRKNQSGNENNSNEKHNMQPSETIEREEELGQFCCDGQENRDKASNHQNPVSSYRHNVERHQADNQRNLIDQVEKPKSAAQQPISKVGEGNLQPSVNPENHNKDNSRQQQIRPSQVKEAKESGMGLLFCASSSVVPKGRGRGRGRSRSESLDRSKNKKVGGSGRELLLEVKVEIKVELNLQTKEAVVLGSNVLRNQAEFVLPVSLHCNE